MQQATAQTSRRPHRSRRSLSAWCVLYAERWQIPEQDLVNQMHGPELLMPPHEFRARIEHLHEIARLLDKLMPTEMQWNFWFRPTLAQPTPPVCRMGWEHSEEFVALQLIAELRALHKQAGAISASDCEHHPCLRLFLPVTTYRSIDWTSGTISTTWEVDDHVRPVRYRTLEFRPGDFARYRPHSPARVRGK